MVDIYVSRSPAAGLRIVPMRLGSIGCGRMATALVQGVVQSGLFSPSDVFVSDRLAAARENLVASCGVNAVEDNCELASLANVILLCVKPQDAIEALSGIREQTSGKLIISIVAGLALPRLEKAAGAGARIVRVMPNTPALIHQGAAAYARGGSSTPEDGIIVERIFNSVGIVFEVKETLLDAVTGLSGSGPAYVYLVIEALADAGVLMGLPRELALQLAAQTVAGSAAMVLRTGAHPAQLRDNVTSPGGTTIAGLQALENAGVRAAFMAAVRAATSRSRELGAAD